MLNFLLKFMQIYRRIKIGFVVFFKVKDTRPEALGGSWAPCWVYHRVQGESHDIVTDETFDHKSRLTSLHMSSNSRLSHFSSLMGQQKVFSLRVWMLLV